MKVGDRAPILHVAGALAVCTGVVSSGIFDGVHTEVGYEHYAEPVVPGLPALVAMPANCLVNMAYVLLGLSWLSSEGNRGRARYLQRVFATMALAYGPVQWVRLWTQSHRAAALDQWLTLLIFAWAVVWCHFLERGWQPGTFLAMEATSAASYSLALLHRRGFELALGGHIVAVVWKAFWAQRRLGDAKSARILALGMVSCLGFVCLKVWDHELAQWGPFGRLTGHFWSKASNSSLSSGSREDLLVCSAGKKRQREKSLTPPVSESELEGATETTLDQTLRPILSWNDAHKAVSRCTLRCNPPPQKHKPQPFWSRNPHDCNRAPSNMTSKADSGVPEPLLTKRGVFPACLVTERKKEVTRADLCCGSHMECQ